MTLTWPDDPEVRRAVASWGHLLDEALIADGGCDMPGVDWPDDASVARALAEWGNMVDSTIAAGASRVTAAFDPTIAWLGGPAVREEPHTLLHSDRRGASPDSAGIVRKHKRARPGQPAMVIGWTVHPALVSGTGGAPPGRAHARSRSQVALMAAAVAAFLLVGGQLAGAPRGKSQLRTIRPDAGDAIGATVPVEVGQTTSSGPLTQDSLSARPGAPVQAAVGPPSWQPPVAALPAGRAATGKAGTTDKAGTRDPVTGAAAGTPGAPCNPVASPINPPANQAQAPQVALGAPGPAPSAVPSAPSTAAAAGVAAAAATAGAVGPATATQGSSVTGGATGVTSGDPAAATKSSTPQASAGKGQCPPS